MNFNEYCVLSARTDNVDLTIEERVENYTFSLFEEVGEVTSLLKKAWWHGHTLDLDELMKEFGDVFWYLSQLKRLLNVSFYDIPLHEFTRKADKLRACMIETGYFVHVGKQDELNRVYWVVRKLMESFDISFAMVLERNVAKLEKRYPEKFNSVDSVKRVDIVG